MASNEGEASSPLLRKEERHYHPGCPGCDHDRKMELQSGMPYKEFLYVWMICLTTGTVFATLLSPKTDGFFRQNCFTEYLKVIVIFK